MRGSVLARRGHREAAKAIGIAWTDGLPLDLPERGCVGWWCAYIGGEFDEFVVPASSPQGPMLCPDLPRMMNLCTSAEGFKPLVGFLDIWGPMPHYLADYDFYRARQAAGDQVWWYVCCAPEPPLPNFLIPQPALDHRILFWLTWKNRVDGFFYWGLNHWTRHRRVKENLVLSEAEGVEPDPAQRWPNRPWFPAGWGDGYLIYPGPDGRPLSSIRLEVIRDGLEDYEYLYLLKQRVEARKAKKQATPHDLAWMAEAEAFLRLDGVAGDVFHYTRSPCQLLRYRERLARLLEAGTRRVDRRYP